MSNQPRDKHGRYGKVYRRPAVPNVKPTQTDSAPVSLSAAAVKERARLAGVKYDPNDRLQTIADIAVAEASVSCERLPEAIRDASQHSGKAPIEVAQQLLVQGYSPATSAAAAVHALGTAA